MKKTKLGVSIVEAMVVILIVTTSIILSYDIYTRSIKYTTAVQARIQAIQIAREWIEAMMNIRDTNWKSFPADKENCWDTLDYDAKCLKIWGNNDKKQLIQRGTPYKIFRDGNWRWKLVKVDNPWSGYNDINYRNNFRVNLDTNWLYTQNWWASFSPLYTREIRVSYESAISWDTKNQAMKIESRVMRVDTATTNTHEIKLESVITNYGG